jgi:PelA/Pel-15E family pectate lyase
MPLSYVPDRAIVFLGLLLIATSVIAAPPTYTLPSGRGRWGESFVNRPAEWYATAEARDIADSVLRYQSKYGAWPKNTDLTVKPTAQRLAELEKSGVDNTIDNGATTVPMQFLALMAQATHEGKYQKSFLHGVDYLLVSQYRNGGWPQFFPLRTGYYSHITYNDDAMMNVMFLLRDVAAGKAPYDFVDTRRRKKASAAVAKGLDCILKTQVRQSGKLTVWCAQHDEKTLEPAWARNFEPPSLSGSESVNIVRFLMQTENPTEEICAAIEGAVAWFKAVQISGLRYHRGVSADGQRDGSVEADPNAGPLWARFYELGSDRPIFTGRDKEIQYALSEIERERRGGYNYYTTAPQKLLENDYRAWAAKHKPHEGKS